jgi:hypothetical protein
VDQGGKQWQTTPKNLPRMQRTRAIPVAWLSSDLCPDRPKGWTPIIIIIIGPNKTGYMRVSAAVIAWNIVFWDGRLWCLLEIYRRFGDHSWIFKCWRVVMSFGGSVGTRRYVPEDSMLQNQVCSVFCLVKLHYTATLLAMSVSQSLRDSSV